MVHQNTALSCPSTPAHPFPDKFSFLPQSSCKRQRAPIAQFLTKDSTIPSFNSRTGADWDQDSREKIVDDFYNVLMSRMNQTGQESFAYKETVELYKSRGKFCGIAVAESGAYWLFSK